MALDVIERMNQQLRNPQLNLAEEKGGILLGHSSGGNNIAVTDFEFVRSSHRRGIAYDLSPHERSWMDSRVRTLSRRRGPEPVGYFRTHLRPGLFLDQSDFALMTETFSECPGIALALRDTRVGVPEAGIFFREDDEIDCRQPALRFPFDAGTLRIQGPTEETPLPATREDAADEPALWKGRRRAWITGLTYTMAGVILILATVAAIYQREKAQAGDKTYAGSSAGSGISQQAAADPAGSETLAAPPAVFDDASADAQPGADSDAGISEKRSPFNNAGPDAQAPATPAVTTRKTQSETSVPVPADAPRFREAAPEAEEKPAAVTPIPLPAAAPVIATAFPPPLPSSEIIPPPPAASPAAENSKLSIDVSVEPKEAWTKRVAHRVPKMAEHVPLLGRLPALRHEKSETVVAARPYANIDPRIPADVSRNLAGQVAVDIEASIDNQGVVRSTEIMKGDDTELAVLAADAVRTAQWMPARDGDRNVPMEVVVHYRFSSGRE